jgi:GNAT superfamily N-acetyltransferase
MIEPFNILPTFHMAEGYVLGEVDPTDPSLTAAVTRLIWMSTEEEAGYSYDEASDYERVQAQATTEVFARTDSFDNTFVGAFCQGNLIGIGVASTSDVMPVTVIRNLAVDPGHRKAGVGRSLEQYIAKQARSLGKSAIHLDSSESAVGFYENRGYKRGEGFMLVFGGRIMRPMARELA